MIVVKIAFPVTVSEWKSSCAISFNVKQQQ